MFIKNKMKKNSREHFSMLAGTFKQIGGGGGRSNMSWSLINNLCSCHCILVQSLQTRRNMPFDWSPTHPSLAWNIRLG